MDELELKAENKRLTNQLEKEKEKFEVVVISAIIGCIIFCGPMNSGDIHINSELLLKPMLDAFAEGAAGTTSL